MTKNKRNTSSSMPSSKMTTGGSHTAATKVAPSIKGYLPVRLRVPKPPQLCQIDDDRDIDDDDSSSNDNDNGDSFTEILSKTTDDTYFYVKEHQGKSSHDSSSTSPASPAAAAAGCTLFVANAPFVPGISTKILLRSLFARFADVTRVTVVPNPRGGLGSSSSSSSSASSSLPSGVVNTTSMGFSYGDGILDGHVSSLALSSQSPTSSTSIGRWSAAIDYPSFLPPTLSEGKYAHVVFSSPKELKKAKSALEDIMKGNVGSDGRIVSASATKKKNKKKKRRHKHNQNSNQDDDEEDNDDDNNNDDDGTARTMSNVPPALTLDSIEIQTLSDESWRQWEESNRKNKKKSSVDESDDDDDDHGSPRKLSPSNSTGVAAIAQRYWESCKYLTRERLLEECNTVMQAYEDAEEAKKLAQAAAKAQPDDDGFVTVLYSSAVGSKSELEQSATATTPSRRKGNKRSRKKKDAVGAQQLDDFYRFQRKESRKRTMDELRKQFQLDLEKVKRLKEERQYRPF